LDIVVLLELVDAFSKSHTGFSKAHSSVETSHSVAWFKKFSLSFVGMGN
jgi:hypothetical protein